MHSKVSIAMVKNIFKNRIIAVSLLAIILLSYITQPSYSKYVYTTTGRVMSSLLSGNGFTNVFVINNDSFIINEATVDSVTSESLHGVGMTKNEDGSYTVPENADTSANGLNSTQKLSFVVQNNSDYDLVACFDIILCMGAIKDGELTCTITAPSSSAESTEKTTLTVTASLSSSGKNSDINLNQHRESENDTNGDPNLPIIDVQYYNKILEIFNIDYDAYSMQVDPTEFLGDQNGDGDVADSNELTEGEFDSFILVHSGETKTFEFSIDAEESFLANFAKNAYAQITMTVKKYTETTP